MGSDKVLVIENLIDKADKLILCGGMAYTFMKVCFGMEIGKSLFDKNGAELAPKLMEKAKAKGVEIVLPCDWACGHDFKNDQEIKMVTKEEGIPEGWEGMDCGPKSMELFRNTVLSSKTVVWNGPAGVFEFDNFSKGTKALLEAVAAPRPPRRSGIWRTRYTSCPLGAAHLWSCWRARCCQASPPSTTSTEQRPRSSAQLPGTGVGQERPSALAF